MKNIINYSFQHDRKTAAYHEAGHVVAALALGLKVIAQISWTGEKPTNEDSCVVGRTYFPTLPRTPLEWSIICWAGPLAEGTLNETYQGDLTFELYWSDFDISPETFSPTDREHMGHRRLARKAFEHSGEIIDANRDMLHQCAQKLVRSLRRDSPVSLPIDFSSEGCCAVLPACVAKSLRKELMRIPAP